MKRRKPSFPDKNIVPAIRSGARHHGDRPIIEEHSEGSRVAADDYDPAPFLALSFTGNF